MPPTAPAPGSAPRVPPGPPWPGRGTPRAGCRPSTAAAATAGSGGVTVHAAACAPRGRGSTGPPALWRRARRLRAAADVTGAAVLLAGLPWGLGRLAGPPLPGHWPGWQQVREFLASPLSDGTAITVLAGAAWLLWAVFAVAVIAEVTAAACGRPVPRLPAIAPVQALAATLAGTVVITALHLPRTAARAAQPPHAALTATVTTAGPLVPGPAAAAAGHRGRSPAAPGTGPGSPGWTRPAPPGHPGERGRTTACTPSWPATTCGTWPAPTSAAGTAGTRSTTSTAAGRSPAGAPSPTPPGSTPDGTC